MAKSKEPYVSIVVESYRPASTSGRHGAIHVRPISGQGYSTDLQVECSRALVRNYPVGTRFRIKAKLTDHKGQTEYFYSHYNWHYEVLGAGGS